MTMPDGAQRREAASLLSDDETDRAVSAEVLRALTVANMIDGRLALEVVRRMAAVHPKVTRARVMRVVQGMIADGTVETFDPARAEASGVGCPCCAGGRDAYDAEYGGRGGGGGGATTTATTTTAATTTTTAAAARPVLRAANAGLGYPVAHAAYCLLSAWGADHGIMDRPSRGRFQRDLCGRGRYGRDLVSESVGLLVEWGVFSISGGAISIAAAERRAPA